MSLAWYVIYSKPNKEEFLCQQLRFKKVEHFYPCVTVIPVNPRSRKIRPYFPGYLFVHLDLDQAEQIPTLQWMPGAVGLVSFDGRAAEVPDGLIIALKQRLGEDAILRKEEHTFKTGDHIHVLSGPFEGYEGIFDTRLSGFARVRILIDILRNQAIKIEMSVKSIKKITN